MLLVGGMIGQYANLSAYRHGSVLGTGERRRNPRMRTSRLRSSRNFVKKVVINTAIESYAHPSHRSTLQTLRGKRTPREGAGQLPAPLLNLGPPPDQSYYLPPHTYTLGRMCARRGNNMSRTSYLRRPLAALLLMAAALAALLMAVGCLPARRGQLPTPSPAKQIPEEAPCDRR